MFFQSFLYVYLEVFPQVHVRIITLKYFLDLYNSYATLGSIKWYKNCNQNKYETYNLQVLFYFSLSLSHFENTLKLYSTVPSLTLSLSLLFLSFYISFLFLFIKYSLTYKYFAHVVVLLSLSLFLQ